MVEPETAGSPMTKRKWVRSSLRKLSQQLGELGHVASAPTLSRLLAKHDYALHVNAKEKEAGSQHPDRDAQFQFIEQQKKTFLSQGQPVISVDTKKKELIGDFKNAGRVWCKEPIEVNVHDFLTAAVGRGAPYGIYDPTRNEGAVYVGRSADTPEFAVSAIAQWWTEHGREHYRDATRLLILADGGGSNGFRARLWKEQLQSQLSDRLGLTVTVSHYPPGCSKWNPIEHRLFSHISTNWAGQPLRTFETMLGYIRHTTTSAGLKVTAKLLEGVFEVGKRVTDAVMESLNIEHPAERGQWNYTLHPRAQATPVT